MKYPLFLGCTVAIIISANVVAKTAPEIQNVAKATTIEIRLQKSNKVGSGVVIHRQGSTYTLVTNRHVLCGGKSCDVLPENERYTLTLADGQKQRVAKEAIKLLGEDLDLAVIQFQSAKQYQVAPIATGLLKVDDPVYTAGFPYEIPGFTFNKGRAIAVVNKRLTADKGGYSIIYNADTLPGMSGGGVFNANGELVAIHGIGDRYQAGADVDEKKLNTKIGYNRGVPVSWLVQSLGKIGINLGVDIAPQPPTAATTADEHFIIGFNKFVDPGANIIAGKQQALAEFNAAIRLNPQYANAYFSRAYLQEQLRNYPQALSDYNQAIAIDPKFTSAYCNRGLLKVERFNDVPGALADYDQTIAINPTYSDAFNNRGLLKADKLNKPQEALADYNQAISLSPKSATTYYNRGLLKDDKLNDVQGALADYNQAIALFPSYAKAYNNRSTLKSGKLKDIPGALADLSQAIDLNPKFAAAFNNRGLLKTNNLNDQQGALADFNRAIILNPKLLIVYVNRGNLKANKLQDIPGALADFNTVLQINPEYAEGYLGRGLVKAKQRDQDGALADWRRSEKLFRSQGNIELADKMAAILKKFGVN
jgi:tetratricopeptide (TPR) repeat protein